jgi:DNA excision repair protein ERCC-2
LKELGQEKGWCPYFLTRHLIHHATVLVYNYQYMLDPKVSNLVSRELEAESIVVFDEAHNIDNVCIEALSVTLDRRRLEASSRSVARLQSKVSEMKATDTAKLAKEYADLVHGLSQQRNTAAGAWAGGNGARLAAPGGGQLSAGGFIDNEAPAGAGVGAGAGGGGGGGAARVQSAADQVLSNPVLSADILEEAVPGNIRKAEHFVAFLKKVVQFLKAQLAGADVTNRTPLAFLHDLFGSTGLERKPLRFTYTRLNSLLRTLEITSLDEFNALQEVANFATLVATYTEGFAVICEPQGSIVAGITEPLLQLCCLDASIAIKPVLDRFQSVVITSGTLSPIDLYPKLLNFQPVQSASLPMSTFRHCLLPLVVTRGSDQIAISTRFELRKDTAVIRNYGQLLIDIAAATPDGICCFFTSYQYMEFVIGEWDKMQILQRVLEHKLIYLETKDVVETTLALDNYKRACDCGRGAVFLSVARGKVAEGIDFDRHYGRCVVIFGIPYQYTLSHVLRARLSFMREKYQIRDNDFLTFDALRQSAQCVGRVIRSKTDYGIVVLADSRYNRLDKRSKFPPWILQFMRESSLNLPTDAAVDQIKSFLRQMGQPIEQEALHSILLNEAQVAALFQQHKVAPALPPAQLQDQAGGKRGREEGGYGSSPSAQYAQDSAEVGAEMETEGDMWAAGYGEGKEMLEKAVVADRQTGVAAVNQLGSTADSAMQVVDSPPRPAPTAPTALAGGHARSLFLFEDILDDDDEEAR